MAATARPIIHTCNFSGRPVFWGHGGPLAPETESKEIAMARPTAGLMLLIAATLGACVAAAAQRTYDRTVQAPPGGRLTFETDVGSVSIVGHDAPEVLIHADLQGSSSFLSHLHISAEQTPSGVTLSAHSAYRGWLGWLDWLDSGPNRARFTVEVPRDYRVDLRTAGGRIGVRDLNASVRAASSGGGAVIRGINGAVAVHTSGGRIEVEHVAGSERLSSSGGGIVVTDSTGDLELSTSGGGIRLRDDDGSIHAVTSGGSIRARLRANRGLSLDTSGGGITLLLPRNARGSIDARSSGGGIRSDFPLSTTQIAADDHLVGAIGGGGAPISLRTSGGSIHIEPGS